MPALGWKFGLRGARYRSMKHLLVADLEATCSNDGSVPRDAMETIEIGAVMVSAENQQPVDEFQSFVRPVRHRKLTDFCCELTSIRQADVDSAPLFPVAFADFLAWAGRFPGHVFCSWGDYDPGQLQQDCTHHGVAYPFGDRHINLKAEFAAAQGRRRKSGLAGALKQVGLSFSGSHHRGIDDARNIVRLLPFIFPPDNGTADAS